MLSLVNRSFIIARATGAEVEWKSWNATKTGVQNRQCWAESVTAFCACWWLDEKR